MKNKLKVLGLAVCGLWMVVLGSYATQLQEQLERGEKPSLNPLQNASCSSGSSGSPE